MSIHLPKEQTDGQHASKVLDCGLQQRHGPPADHESGKHYSTRESFGEKVKRKIAEAIGYVEKQNQKRELLSNEPQVLAHSICLGVSKVALDELAHHAVTPKTLTYPVDSIEEIHDAQERQQVHVHSLDCGR